MRAFVLLAAVLFACGPSQRDPGGGGGGNGDGPDAGGGGGGGGGGSGSGNEDGCSEEAKLVYVVDSNNKFSKFDPATKMFMDIGTLSCPAQLLATPFSMGLDRDAVAWVLYSSGELFRVDTTNLNCTKSTWASPNGLLQFGMGFSTNTQGGTEDTLFVAGGAAPTGQTSSLATVSTQTFAATPVGTVTGWPELTGTGNAELWGWFPSDSSGTTPPRVEQINKTTGAAMKTFMMPDELKGAPGAWAFAAWGGDFWIFLAKGTGKTIVYQIDGTNGTLKGQTPTQTRTIVGAGVSTCAPVVIF